MISRNTKLGNMADVYRDVARTAEASIRQSDERRGPFAAEIVEGCTPHWHVLITAPAHEQIAAAHLVARGFGIYHPTFEQKVPRCGARAAHVARRPLLPGYLFLFVWDLNRHWRRVRACPGVIDLLLDGSGRPAIVAEEMIDYLQAKEFSESGFRNFKRNRRKRRGAQPSDIEDYIVTIKTYSALEGIEQLDQDQRSNLFRKAMGL
jgi:transcription antitermination factor NusG